MEQVIRVNIISVNIKYYYKFVTELSELDSNKYEQGISLNIK